MIDAMAATARATAQGLHRTFDASILNGIVNGNPEIARAVCHDPADGPIDFSGHLLAPESFIGMDNRADGGALFEWSSPGHWEAHTLFAETCRGSAAINFAMQMIREMFTIWDAEEIWGATPADNRAAHIFNRKVGAEYFGQGVHHTTGHVLHFRIIRTKWMPRFG